MAYTDKPFGWDVHQKAADKFYAIQRQFFPITTVFIILYPYCYRVFIYAQNPAVTDYYPVRVTPKIVHHGFRPGKGFPDVRDTVFFITGIQQLLVFVSVAVFGCLSFITEISRFMHPFQTGQKFPLEKCGHCLSRQEETTLFLIPVPVCVKPSASTEHMDMEMVRQVRAPRVHDADETGSATHMPWISGKFYDCLCHGTKKQRIQFLLITVDQGI